MSAEIKNSPEASGPNCSDILVEIKAPEDIKSQLLTAFESIDVHSSGHIDRCGLRSLLRGFRVPLSDSEDLVELLFRAMGIELDGRCCIHQLLNALQPHLGSCASSSVVSGEVVGNAIRSFLDASKVHSGRIVPVGPPVAYQDGIASAGENKDRAADRKPADLEAQRPQHSVAVSPRCAALMCCALLVAAAITFGICLAAAKMGSV